MLLRHAMAWVQWEQRRAAAGTSLRHSGQVFIAGGVTNNAGSSNSLYLGYGTQALANGDTNEIVIGASATGSATLSCR